MEKVLKAGIIDIPNFKSILADNSERWEEFLVTTNNFKAKRKGFKGGLKSFYKELGQERNELGRILDKYKILRSKKSLSTIETTQLQKIESEIPLEIRKGWKRGSKGLALKWMANYYPCSRSTLMQIIRYKPK